MYPPTAGNHPLCAGNPNDLPKREDNGLLVPGLSRGIHCSMRSRRSVQAMTFLSIYRHGFVRVAACTTACTLADPDANAEAILHVVRQCEERAVALAVFPELALSGYSIDDLLLQDALLDGVEHAIGRVVEGSAGLAAPLVDRCAAAPRRASLRHCRRDPGRPVAGRYTKTH